MDIFIRPSPVQSASIVNEIVCVIFFSQPISMKLYDRIEKPCHYGYIRIVLYESFPIAGSSP